MGWCEPRVKNNSTRGRNAYGVKAAALSDRNRNLRSKVRVNQTAALPKNTIPMAKRLCGFGDFVGLGGLVLEEAEGGVALAEDAGLQEAADALGQIERAAVLDDYEAALAEERGGAGKTQDPIGLILFCVGGVGKGEIEWRGGGVGSVWAGGSGAGVRGGGVVGGGGGRRSAQGCQRWRRLRGGLALGVRGREAEWRCGSRERRIDGCRKILRGREAADRFRRFRNRWKCAPWFRGGRGLRQSCAPGRRERSGVFGRRGRCVRRVE